MRFGVRSVLATVLAVAMMASVLVVTDSPSAAGQEAPPSSASAFTPIADAGLDQVVGVVADGADVGGSRSPGHHTIYPTESMPFEQFSTLFDSLPWQYGGKVK